MNTHSYRVFATRRLARGLLRGVEQPRTLHALLLALSINVGLGAGARADDVINRSDYAIDEATLPFDALPGTETTRYWGVHQGAGSNLSSNADTVYQSDSDPALSASEEELNAMVLRVEAHHRPEDGLANIPAVQGTPSVPVMSMHTIGDLQVPLSMQQSYARRVAANGAGHLLATRAIRAVEHCGFRERETEEAFGDLATWVRHGVRPAHDDILDPQKVASWSFGCAFTRAVRPNVPGCSP